MTYQEKRSLISIISSLVIFGLYGWFLYRNYLDEFLRTDDYSFWGKAILLMIPVFIVIRIVIHIFFIIVMKVTTSEDEPPADEREKLIELKSARVGHVIFMVGFLLSMISVTLHYPMQAMFLILIASGLLAGVVEEITQIIYHRRGI